MADVDGLHLCVNTKGRKHWHFRFSFARKRARISFGSYPEISLQQARDRCRESRSLVANGIDPRKHRKAMLREAEITAGAIFQTMYERWRDHKALSLRSGRQSILSQIKRIFAKDVLPDLAKLSVFDISRADLLKVLRKIEKRKALTTARKCRSWFNQLFRYAMVELDLPSNPAADLDIVAVPQAPVTHNPFLKLDALPSLLAKLQAYEGVYSTRLGIWILPLTGVRTGELRFATPDQLDFENGLWTIPPETVKQLQKRMRKGSLIVPSYVVPLSSQATELFKGLIGIRALNQKYVLGNRDDPMKPISENTLNVALKRMGYEGRLTGHGIRATISTALNELDYRRDWIEAQLSHADSNKVRATYNHAQYVEQRRQMMQDWADRLERMLPKGQGIVPLGERYWDSAVAWDDASIRGAY